MISMKRIISISLILLLCMPFAVNGAEEHTYFAYTFSSLKGNQTNILDPFMLKYVDLTTKGVNVIADAAKTHLDKMPSGRRCINIYLVSRQITANKENSIFWDKGVTHVKEIVTLFFKKLHDMNVPLDYVIDDMEEGSSNWVLTDSEKIKAIENDARYKTEIKPLLIESDFPFGNEEQGDLYYVQNWNSHPLGYLIWNRVMGNFIAKHYDRCIYEPIKSFYPNIKLSNYSYMDSDGITSLSDTYGHKIYKAGSRTKVGTHSSPVGYGGLNQITNPGRAPDGYPFSQYKITAFNCLLMDQTRFQEAVLCTPEGKIMPWVGLKTWTEYADCKNYMRTDYYQEFIFHTALLNPDPFLLFDIGGDNEATDVNTLSQLLSYLDKVTGKQAGTPLIKKVTPWHQRYLLTGMDLADKSIWRITPDLYTKGVSIENFLVSEAPIVFRIGNQTVTFPEGSIIEKSYEKLSEYGYWITAPKGAAPAETIDPTLTAPGEPVFTEDYIPTGYLYESETKKNNADAVVPIATGIEPEPKISNKTSTPVESHSEVKGHWAQKELDALIKVGILAGTENGIEADKTLTKAEFITMLIRSLEIQTIAYESNFIDVKNEDWHADAMQTAFKYGWIVPDNDCLYPDIPLTREETAFILSKALGVSYEPIGEFFSDHEQIRWESKGAVYGLSRIGIFTGYPDGSFKPQDILTRAQGSVLIYRSMM